MKSTPSLPIPYNTTRIAHPITPQACLQDGMYSGHPEELALSSATLVGLMRQVFSKGMQFRFQARGASMAPFIQDGDVICIAPLGKNGPGLGEVTAFLHPQNGRLVVHRVVGKHGVTCLIQGDNLPGSPDGLVSIENLLGRVTTR